MAGRRNRFIKHGTLPQLAVLEAVVRLGTFSHAARELHMAQPTASGLVRRLEESAHTTLFEKCGRYVAPTAAGRLLCARAIEVFALLRALDSDLAKLREREPAATLGDSVFTTSETISLGVIDSSETRKNGIPKPRVRALDRASLPHAAVCTAARSRVTTMHRAGQPDAPRSSRTMDDTIDYSIVFAKTQKGVAEINARSGALTLQARRVLIMIDGRRPVAELMAVVRSGEFDGIISQLETHGMIDKVDLSSLPSRDYEAEDFADTISLLQENATALRSMPHISPAELAANAQAARTAAASGEQREEAANDAAAIAARAVASASASAPRTIEAAMRRPPTISIASPVAQEMASGTARPGTINVPLRTTEPPVRRPPTLSGVRPAPVAEHGNAAVETPVRPVVAEKAPARIEPAAAPARTEPAAAPAPASAPAANTPVRSFEEEKRHAVKELYAVLGPYGEQPVAALQECKTIEALREQIKQAGRRVVTFRGEKAAQDFLRAVGQA